MQFFFWLLILFNNFRPIIDEKISKFFNKLEIKTIKNILKYKTCFYWNQTRLFINEISKNIATGCR